MNRCLIVPLLLFILAGTLFPQVVDPGLDRTDLKKNSEDIMRLLVKEEYNKAFNEVRKICPLPGMEIDSLEIQTIKQLSIVKERFGRSIDFILAEEKETVNTFVRFIYIIKYERHVTRWVFIYYKPRNKWILNSFKWDDDVNSLM